MTDEQVVWQKFTSDRVMRYLLDRLPPPLRPAGFAYDYGKDGRMNEQEWLTGTDPARMLTWLTQSLYPENAASYPLRFTVPTARTLRLFACGLCRLVWDGAKCDRCMGTGCDLGPGQCPRCRGTGRAGGITDPRSRKAVEVAERYADGEATGRELVNARQEASDAHSEIDEATEYDAWACTLASASEAVEEVLSLEITSTRVVQAQLLRCVAGNPFRPVRWRCPTCGGTDLTELTGRDLYCGGCDCSWHAPFLTPSALAIARTAYDERDWSLLPVLADALEDGGCDSADLLAHLRGPGPHCRGCWAVDLILGKE